jgi:hypothetical protein
MDFNLLGNILNTETDFAGLKTAQRSMIRDLVFQEARINELEKRIVQLEEEVSQHVSRKEQLFTIQSSDEVDEGVGAVHEEHEVVEFAEGIEDNTDGKTSVLDPIHTGLAESYALGDFMSRPTLIHSYSIPQGEAFSNSRIFFPWLNYFTNPKIMKKLDNFAYIRCDLKLKFVVNSSPFIYGNYCAAYQPLPYFNRSLRTANPMPYNDRIMLSQRPNVMIESHKNKGGELTCPFFYHKDWLTLDNDGLEEMGELTLFQYAPFQAANPSATGNVTINVYAWAENVKLTGATVLNVQSDDEYGKGPVSKVASAVASVSSALEEVPVIGLFAKATTIGANAVGSIASLFGFTNVPVISDVMPFKNQPFHGFASSEIGVPIEKLTLDPKNELTIDPRVTGLDEDDELAICNLVGRESFIDISEWGQSLSKDDNIYQISVTPTNCQQLNSATNDTYYETPLAHVSRMFGNWRGSIIYKIKIVASPYHQGRLRVSYDPRGDVFAENDTDNVVVTKVVDLSVTDEAEFVIPYMQPQSWQEVDQTEPYPYWIFDSSFGFAPAYDDTVCNGRLRISVLNPLTGPDTTSNVQVLLFMKAGPDFELANPGAMPNHWTPLDVQSADEIVSADGKITYVMGEMTSRPVDANLVHFGEAIRSVRSVMRRTNYHMPRATFAYTVDPADSWVQTRVSSNIYPAHYGYTNSAYWNANRIVGTGATPGNPSYSHPVTWMSMCFAGVRGSMHYNYNQVGSFEYPSITVTRNLATLVSQAVSSGDYKARANELPTVGSVNSGCMLQNERTQNGVQFSVPFMSKYKFTPCDPYRFGRGDSTYYNTEEQNYSVIAHFDPASIVGTPYRTRYDVYCGIGTDFTLLNFIGVPPKHRYDIEVNGVYSTDV